MRVSTAVMTRFDSSHEISSDGFSNLLKFYQKLASAIPTGLNVKHEIAVLACDTYMFILFVVSNQFDTICFLIHCSVSILSRNWFIMMMVY